MEKFTDQHSLIDENSMGDWNRVTDPTHINGETRDVVDSWGTVKFDKEERAGENFLGAGHTLHH